MTDNNRNVKISISAPTSGDYVDLVNHQLASGMVGRKELWPRSSLVLPNEVGYFKPETTLYLETFRKDRRNAKELEYVHSAGCWVEQCQSVLILLREKTDTGKQSRLLGLIEEALGGARGVLAMRTAHFQTILSKWQSQANQIADLVETCVEAKHHQVPSEAYADVYEELSGKHVIETAKCMAKDATGGSKKLPRSDALGIISLALLATSSLGKYTTKCKELGDYRCFVIRHPRSNIWRVESSSVTIYSWTGAPGDPSNTGRHRFRAKRPLGGLSYWNLPTGECRIRATEDGRRCDYLQCFCNKVKGKTALGDQSERTEPALGQTFSLPRNTVFVWGIPLPRGPPTVFRLGVGLPALCAAFPHVGLVLIQVRWKLLLLYSASIWVDRFSLLVCEVAQSAYAVHAQRTISTSIGLVRRVPDSTRRWKEAEHSDGLPSRFRIIVQAIRVPWLDETPRKRGLGDRSNKAGTSGTDHRYSNISLLHNSGKVEVCTIDGRNSSLHSPEAKPLGQGEFAFQFLWQSGVTTGTSTSCPILYAKSLRFPQEGSATSRTLPREDSQTISRGSPGLTVLGHNASGGWTSHWRRRALLVPTHRCSRFGLWCNTGTRHAARITGGDYRTGHMVPFSATKVHYAPRTKSGTIGFGGRPGSSAGFRRQIDDYATFRQHGRVPHHSEHGICDTRAHARAPSATPHPSANESHNSSELAPVSFEQTRGQPQSDMEPSRLGSHAITAGVRRNIAASTNLAALLAIGRSASRPTQSYHGAIRRTLGRRTRSVMESASSLDMGNAYEDPGRRGSRDHYRPALDRSAMVREIEDTLAQRTSHQAGTRASTVLIGSSQPRLEMLLCEVGKPHGKHCSDLLPLSSLALPLEGQQSA